MIKLIIFTLLFGQWSSAFLTPTKPVSVACLFLCFMSSKNAISAKTFYQHVRLSLNLLTTEEMEKLMQHATECSENECTVEAVSDLLQELHSQEGELDRRLKKIRGMIESLESSNEQGNERSEVGKIVDDIMRVFMVSAEKSGCDYPDTGIALGFSGDIRKPTTAYKALNPKPWKPKE